MRAGVVVVLRVEVQREFLVAVATGKTREPIAEFGLRQVMAFFRQNLVNTLGDIAVVVIHCGLRSVANRVVNKPSDLAPQH